MKKLLVIAVISSAFMSQHAFAQAKNFEGFSVAANVTSAKTGVDLTIFGLPLSTDGNTTGLDLQAQYSLALSPQFVLGLGATIGTGTNNAGSIFTAEFSSKNRTAIDFIPGFAVSDSTLIFGKLSFLNTDVTGTVGNVSESKSITGTGYGFGLRNLINKNVFFQLGYDVNKYQDVDLGSGNTAKPSSTVLSGGLGYKF
jgi:opacity protein-like surface antigen